MKIKALSLMLVCCMVMTVVSLPVSAETGDNTGGNVAGGTASGNVAGGATGGSTTGGSAAGGNTELSGQIGSVEWSISGDAATAGGGTLIISGSGEIPDFTMEDAAPWAQYSGNIYGICIKNGITGIGDFAFYGCKYVNCVSIPETLETIGVGAFAGISQLCEFEIDSENTSFFADKDALYSKDNKTLIVKMQGNSNFYCLPDSVTDIAPYAFYWNTVLDRIVLGNQLESIGESAFYECNEDLVFYYTGTEAEWTEKVEIGENNESLSSVVYDSKRLSGLTLSDSEIGLETGTSVVLDAVFVPEDAAITDIVWSVGDSAVAWVENGKVTGMGAGVTYVRATSVDGGYSARCTVRVTGKGSLSESVAWAVSPDQKTLTISGNGEVPSYTGTGCAPWEQYRQKIEKIVVESGITGIGSYGFAETKCKEVVLPDGLLFIGDSAFCFSENLERINFPSGLTSIGQSAFSNCTKIMSVNLPDSVTYIGANAFNNCTKMVSLRLPEGIESIENGTFNYCRSLKAVKIPDSVKTIGTYAFWICEDIETIVLGSKVTTVGYDAFQGLSDLKTVYYKGTSEQWDTISFGFDNESIKNANRIYGYEPVTAIQLDTAELEMNVRDTKTLSASFAPENASMPYVMWSSSDESVAVVDAEGNVTAKSKGTATITATAIGESVSASCTVTTQSVPVSGMVIEESTVDMVRGKEYQLTLVFSPQNATNRNIKWTSDNEDAVVVTDDGLLRAVGIGTANVIGVTEDGEYSDSVVVRVSETIAEGVLDGGITWKIDYNGTLTVRGTGEMPDFYPNESADNSANGTVAGGTTDKDGSSWSETLAPWYDYNQEIRTVSVEDGITSIGDYAFAYCNNLENIHIAATVTDIGKNAFANSSAMNIYLPEALVSIGEGAFWYNNRLTYIYLPSSLTSIGKSAFEGCWELRSIMLPQKLESIDSNAFSNTNISFITIPASVKTIGEGAFSRNSSLSGFYVEGADASFTVYNGILYDKDMTRLLACPNLAVSGTCELPQTVEKIDAGAFCNNYNLNNIILPESLRIIGDDAFSGCSSLNSIYVPDGVTTIGKRAFSSCQITYFRVPAGVTEISEGMLSSCWNLQNVYIHDAVTVIANSAFSGTNLSNGFEFPSSLREIGSHAFSSTQLSGDLRLPDGLEKIGERAFMYSNNLCQVYIPSSVTSIGEAAFVGSNMMSINVDEQNSSYTDLDGVLYNKALTSLMLCPARKGGVLVAPDTVERVESYAFNRAMVSGVMLPDGVTYIGNDAFSECPNLLSVRIPDSVTSMGYNTFYNCAMLRSVGLPAGITELPDGTFNNCTMLESVTIGKNVETILWSAFYNCRSLREIRISSKLEEIMPNAFYMADNLSTIVYEGTAEDWSNVIIGEQNGAIRSASLIADADFVSGISISTKSVQLKIGETLQLSAEISPEADGLSAEWSVADPIIATAENGLVAAMSAGNTAVIAKTPDGCYIDYCNVSVSAGGNLSESVEWSLKDGVLTVSGEGEIPDYDDTATADDEAPWGQYREKIKSIVIGEGITSIGNNAFRDNWNTESIVIAQTVQSIGDRAFALCECVSRINIPKGVTSIGEEAFEGMWELASFSVDAENESFSARDGVLFNKEQTVLVAYPMSKKGTTYKIPAGVTKIADSAFRRNQYLEALIMPDGLAEIGEYAFADIIRLHKVIMPESINIVGDGIFRGGSIGTIVYGGDDEKYEALVSRTSDNMGLPASVYVIYNTTMPVVGNMTEPIVENGILRVSVWFEAMFEECNVIFAVYDNNHKLVKTIIRESSGDTATGNEFTAEVQGEALGYTVKVFFWDKENSMRILGKPLEYYISPTIETDAVLESPHPYAENNNTPSQRYDSPVGTKIEVTFDEQTKTEEGVDFILIYDGDGNLIGRYSGTELAGKTVTIPGRTVVIKLTSDEYFSYYGYKTSKIVVYK